MNIDLAHVREEPESRQAAGFDGAAQEVLIQIVARRELRREERHHHRVRTRLHLNMNIGRAAGAPPRRGRHPYPNRTACDSLAVDQQFELLAANFAESAVVVHHALVDGENLEHVIAVGRELVLRDQAAAGAERHAFDVIILRSV